MYGVLERQFRRYFHEADRRRGITGETLLQLLESRLDNIVYRLGFAASRPQARQLVRHGHFLVNGRRADVPSYALRAGDRVSVKAKSANNPAIAYAREEVKGRGIPEWLELGGDGQEGRFTSVPTREQLNLPVQEPVDRGALLEVGRTGASVNRAGCAERTDSMLWRGFQRPKVLEYDRETLTGPVRALSCAAVRARLRHDDRERAAARAAVVD